MNARAWLLGIRRGLTALLLLLVVLVLVVTFMLHNERGTAFLLQRALTIVPVDLAIERSTGALADGVTLHGLRYRSDKVDVSIGQTDVLLSLGALLGAQVHVQRLELVDTTVSIAKSDAPSEPSPLTVPRLGAPIPIRIDVLSAVNTSIVTGETLKIERIDGGLAWVDTQLTAQDLRVVAEAWSVGLAGAVTLDDPVPVDLDRPNRRPGTPM